MPVTAHTGRARAGAAHMGPMTTTQRPPLPPHPMRYVFPAKIYDADTAAGLPAETVITALNMRWLVDGRGTCWPAGSGSGMRFAELLEHGPIVVELPPVIAPGTEVETIDRHLGYAVLRRRHIDENTVALLEIPEPVAATRKPENRVRYRLGIIKNVPPTLPPLRTDLSAWLTARLAELNLTVEQAREMTARQFPMELGDV